LSAEIAGSVANNRAILQFINGTSTVNNRWSFHFTYLIV
jgi:hypothetical protein